MSGLGLVFCCQSELAFAKENLFDPLGDNVEWPSSPDDLNSGGFGLKMKPRDLAKIGLLVFNHGVWDGKRIISEVWLRESTSRIQRVTRFLANTATTDG